MSHLWGLYALLLKYQLVKFKNILACSFSLIQYLMLFDFPLKMVKVLHQ